MLEDSQSSRLTHEWKAFWYNKIRQNAYKANGRNGAAYVDNVPGLVFGEELTTVVLCNGYEERTVFSDNEHNFGLQPEFYSVV